MSKKLMYSKWFTALADEIREIKDSDEKINAQDFENNILSLGTPKNLKEILDTSHSMAYYFAVMIQEREQQFDDYSYYATFPITAEIPFDLTENVYDFSYTFQLYVHDKVPIFDMSKAKNLTCTFRYCVNLVEYINLSFGQNYENEFRIAKNTFWDCTNLKKVKVYCPNATYTDFGIRWGDDEPTYTADENGDGIFAFCHSLETIDVVELSVNSFYGNSLLNCYSLKNIVVRSDNIEGNVFRYLYFLINSAIDTCCHFTGEVNETYNPKGLKDGKVYIKDEFVEYVKSYLIHYGKDNFIYPLSEYKE